MKHMKQLSVRYQNPALNLQELLWLSQQPDEGVRSYLSRLRGVSARCQFNVTCECGEQINVVRFKLIAGLNDPEIKEDILSIQHENLEDTVKKTRKVVNWQNGWRFKP